jgi:tetratricopeptide (TPR) repeat protein
MGRILFIIIFFALAGFAQERTDSLIMAGIRAVNRQEFKTADSLFQLLPGQEPFRDLFRVLALQAEMSVTYDFRDSDRVFRYCDAVFEKSKILVKQRSAKGYFCIGTAYGARAVFKENKKSWFSSFKDGIRGVEAYQKCLELDPRYHDVYAGLGIYHYWKSNVTRYLSWLPFLDDERELGKRELTLALKKGVYFNEMARHNLLWIYFAEKNFEQSLHLADEFLSEYPENTLFLRSRCDVLYQKHEYAQAADAYLHLLAVLKRKPTEGGISEIQCHYMRGLALEKGNRHPEASLEYNNILSYRVPRWAIGQAARYKQKAQEALLRMEQQ